MKKYFIFIILVFTQNCVLIIIIFISEQLFSTRNFNESNVIINCKIVGTLIEQTEK